MSLAGGTEPPVEPPEPSTRPDRSTSTLRANLRSLPGPVWVLFVGAFVNRLGTFLLPFITLYLTDRGYSAPQAGLGLAAYGVGALGSQPLGGLLADRLGRRWTIAMSTAGGGLLTLSLVWVQSLAGIVVVMAVLGLVAEFYRPASSALITDLVPAQGRIAAFGVYRLMLNLGFAVGLAFGGFLADRSYSLLFVGDAATSLGFALIAVLFLPHGTRTSRSQERHLTSAGRSILADRGFLLVLGAVFLTATVYMQNATTFALQVRDLGFTPQIYGLLQAMNGILVVIFELPVAAWAQHRDRARLIALGALLVGAAFTSLTVVQTLPGLLLMVVVWTFGEIVESPATSAFVADRAPDHARGRYQAALGMMYASSAIVGPLAGTAVFAASPTALWLGCGVISLGGAGLALAARKQPTPLPNTGHV